MELGERKHLIHEQLLRTREELLQVIGQLQPSDWDRPVQSTDGGWTVKQMLLHLATAENGQLSTGKAIAAGQNFGLGLQTEGLLDGWGDNTYGQKITPKSPGITAIAAGDNFDAARIAAIGASHCKGQRIVDEGVDRLRCGKGPAARREQRIVDFVSYRRFLQRRRQ